MSRRRNRKNKELFYVELRVAGQVPLFIRPLIIQKMTSALKWTCEKRGLRIYDYSILPDRIIMIAGTAWGTLQEVLDAFRGFTSKAVMLLLRRGSSNLDTSWMVTVFKEYVASGRPEGIHIWEEELYLESVYRQDQIDEYSVKIQQRAVKAGLVAKPEHYLNCSANPQNPLEGWIVEATDPWS